MRLTKGNPFLAGAVVIAGITAVVLLAVSINTNFGLPMGLNLGWPPSFDYNLSAAFDDANGLSKGADVVVAGHAVGQVTNVQPAGRQALVTMRIDSHYAPMHRGSIARIRYSTLLAQKFVEMTPAAGTPPIPSGSRVPSTSTITPVDFDQFLSTLDPQTRTRLQTLVQQLGGGVQGREQVINQLLDQWGHLAVESQPGLDTVSRHSGDIGNITTNLDITSRRLALSHDQLGGFIQHTGEVNGTLAGTDKDLAGFFFHLANTMTDFNQTLTGEEGNFHDSVVTFDPFLVQLNGTLATVYPYVHNNLGALQTGITTLVPYIGSAIAEQDANGNYLRQFLVNDCRYDAVQPSASAPNGCPPSAPAESQNSTGAPANSGGQGGLPVAVPTAPQLIPTLCPSLPPVLASARPPALPTPIPSIKPCPTPPLPCFPGPGHPTPSPIPTPSPGSCIPAPGAINPPGTPPLPVTVPSVLPSFITGLVGGGI